MMFEIDDEIIVARVMKGDRDAFEMLVTKYQAPIYNLMCRTAPAAEDAAELAQEVFLKAFARIRTYRSGRKNVFSWLYAIGLNTARDYLRRQQRRGDHLGYGSGVLEEPKSEKVDAANQEQHLVDLQTLRQTLLCLSLGQRETLMLRYRYGLTVQEIADMFGISASAVKMRVQRGLAELRRRMTAKD
jgi:RNA polymerase sigma-70 factor, ECF subfamily